MIIMGKIMNIDQRVFCNHMTNVVINNAININGTIQ